MTPPELQVNSSRSDITRIADVIRAMTRDLPRALSVGVVLAARDFKLRYMTSALGYLWAILSPLAYAFVFVVIRHGMKGAGLHIDTGGIHPGLFALVGIVLYQSWLDGLMTQLEVLRVNKDMVRSMSLPVETYFIAAATFSGFGLLIRMGIIGVALLALGVVPASTWWQFPLWAAAAVFTGNALGFILSLMGNFYRDIRNTFQSITIGMILVSPVFYPPTSNSDSVLYYINIANPFAATMATARDALLGGQMILFTPAICWTAALAVLVLLMFVVNRVVYRIVSERLA